MFNIFDVHLKDYYSQYCQLNGKFVNWALLLFIFHHIFTSQKQVGFIIRCQ
jgi:hypothetical protein